MIEVDYDVIIVLCKYFHDNDFTSAKNWRGSSNSWEAILHGIEALKLGLVSRVGDGSSIWLWLVHGFLLTMGTSML